MENGIALSLIFYIMLLHFLHLLLASFVFPSSSFTARSAQIALEPGQAGGRCPLKGPRRAPRAAPHVPHPGQRWRGAPGAPSPLLCVDVVLGARCVPGRLAPAANPRCRGSESGGWAAPAACYCALRLPGGLGRATCFICPTLGNGTAALHGCETELSLY